MKILYYDCFSGISGDMNLGAMIDLGVDGGYLKEELSKLGLDSEFTIRIGKGTKNGIAGTKVDVVLTHKDHAHEDHDDGHSHRHLKDIEKIIRESGLNERVKKSCMDMFMRIAAAEAKVHGKPIEEVHFHEVGAVDSIVDMAGAAIALDFLRVDQILCSPVQVGGGFVTCAHGVIPVPGPATTEILRGVPLRFGAVPYETTTPTGAAILAANVTRFTETPEFSIEKTGYGLGNRDLDIPNVLRVYLGTSEDGESAGNSSDDRSNGNSSGLEISHGQSIIETNIDDMNPEIYNYIEERLFESGALDVYKTPIIMKKGRPAVKLSVLVDFAKEKNVLDIIFRETTSIGIRKTNVEKIMLQRSLDKVRTSYGEISIKNSYYQGEWIKYKAEYEDCKKLAMDNNVPIAAIYREINLEMGKMKQSGK